MRSCSWCQCLLLDMQITLLLSLVEITRSQTLTQTLVQRQLFVEDLETMPSQEMILDTLPTFYHHKSGSDEITIEFAPIDVEKTISVGNTSRLYLYNEFNRNIPPKSVLEGYRIGSKYNDKLKVVINIGNVGVTKESCHCNAKYPRNWQL